MGLKYTNFVYRFCTYSNRRLWECHVTEHRGTRFRSGKGDIESLRGFCGADRGY